MRVFLKRILVQAAGWVFIALGIVGLFLPILQGTLFILIGLAILSTEYVWAHRLLTRLRQRFPKLDRMMTQAMDKAQGWLRKVARKTV